MPDEKRLDAIALLKADHRNVEDLFAEFKAAKGAAKKQALVEKICAELSGHTAIEEEIFYPACRGKVEDGLLNEGYVEHDSGKVLIAELLASAPNEEFYDAKVKVLSEQIEHHVHEEEKRSDGIFSQGTGETDSLAEGSGFELSVPPQKERPFGGASPQFSRPYKPFLSFRRVTKIAATVTGNRGFESASLHRRVCEL
jgi:hemerythrin superfamily protein